MFHLTGEFCSCGSGIIRRAVLDGHGIFLCYACDKCEADKLSRYRVDIMERYHASEPLDDEC